MAFIIFQQDSDPGVPQIRIDSSMLCMDTGIAQASSLHGIMSFSLVLGIQFCDF